MGICGSVCGSNSKNNELNAKVVDGFLDKEIPLSFKVQMDNFKGKGLKVKDSYITIKFGDREEIRSKKYYDNGYPNYDMEDNFIYNCTTKALTKQYLFITFFGGKKNEELGSIKISLYTVATGAYHFDYTVMSESSYLGRCSFDIKMSQKVVVEIKSCTLVAKVLDNLNEKNYFYNFTLLDGEHTIESDKSAEFENVYLNRAMIDREHSDEDSSLNESQLSEKNVMWQGSGSQRPEVLSTIVSDFGSPGKLSLNNSFSKSELNGYDLDSDTEPHVQMLPSSHRLKEEKKENVEFVEEYKKPINLENYVDTKDIGHEAIGYSFPAQPTVISHVNDNKYTKVLDDELNDDDISINENQNELFIITEKSNDKKFTSIRNLVKISKSTENDLKSYLRGETKNNLQPQDLRESLKSETRVEITKNESQKITGKSQFHKQSSNEQQQKLAPANINGTNSTKKKSETQNRKKTMNNKADFDRLNEKMEKNKQIWDDPEGISITYEFFLEDVNNISMQFSIWIKKPVVCMNEQNLTYLFDSGHFNENQPKTRIIELKLLGDCYFSFSSFIRHLFIKDTFSTPNVEKKFENKLWKEGISKGTLKGNIFIKCSQFLKQVVCGVNTENGIQKSAGVVYAPSKNKRSFKQSREEIIAISELTKSMKENQFKILGDADKNNFTETLRNSEQKELVDNLNKILVLLNKTEKTSLISFTYVSESELHDAQETQINQGKHLVRYCQEALEDFRQFYYESLKALLKRGELALQFLGASHTNEVDTEGFKSAVQSNFKSNNSNKQWNINIRLKNALRYQKLLYRSLELALHLIIQKALTSYERDFIEYFQAISYIRIPQFHEELNKVLQSSFDKSVPLNILRGTEYEGSGIVDIVANDSMQLSGIPYTNKKILEQFDWKTEFYKHLIGEKKYDQNVDFLNKILEDHQWHTRFIKKGVGFFLFIKELCDYIVETLVNIDKIPWQDIPGYKLILRAFLVEMQSRDLKAYPEALISATNSMQKNMKLLNIFCNVIYRKTNIYQGDYVFRAFDLIDNWICIVKKQKKIIPTNFDHYGLIKGIFMVLQEDESFLSVAKAIWFVYRNFYMFPEIIQHEFHEYLFGKMFLGQFLHWNVAVRKIFHHLVYFRIYHKHKNLTCRNLDPESLRWELVKILNGNQINQDKKYDIFNDQILLELNKIFRFLVCANKKHKDNFSNYDFISKSKRIADVRRYKNGNKKLEDATIFYKDVCSKLDLEQLANFFTKDLKLSKNELPMNKTESLNTKLGDTNIWQSEKFQVKSNREIEFNPSKFKKNKEEEDPRLPHKKSISMQDLSEVSPQPKELNLKKSLPKNHPRKGSGNLDKFNKQMIQQASAMNIEQTNPNSFARKSTKAKTTINKETIIFKKQRVFIDLNDKTDAMKQEKSQLVYLEISLKEFFELKKDYEEWNKGFLVNLGDKTGKKAKDVYMDYDVPVCDIPIISDKVEAADDGEDLNPVEF